ETQRRRPPPPPSARRPRRRLLLRACRRGGVLRRGAHGGEGFGTAFRGDRDHLARPRPSRDLSRGAVFEVPFSAGGVNAGCFPGVMFSEFQDQAGLVFRFAGKPAWDAAGMSRQPSMRLLGLRAPYEPRTSRNSTGVAAARRASRFPE